MIRRHDAQRPAHQARPEAVLMLLVAEGRRHHADARMVPIGVEILALVQRQVLDQRLAPDTLAKRPRPPDRLMGILRG